MAKIVERFLELIMYNQEQALLDFKQDFYKIHTPTGQNEFLKDVMAIYNTPNKFSGVVQTTLDGKYPAGYLVFGIATPNNATRQMSKQACPLPEENPAIDVTQLQDLLQRLTVVVHVTYNEIILLECLAGCLVFGIVSPNNATRQMSKQACPLPEENPAIDVSQLQDLFKRLTELPVKRSEIILLECPQSIKEWLKPGRYGLLEIGIDTRYGPAIAKEIRSGHNRGTKNKIADKIYYRKQATNCTIQRPQDNDIEAQIYAKFDPGFNNPEISKRLVLVKDKMDLLPKSHLKALILDATDRDLSEITNVLQELAANGCNVVFDLDPKSDTSGALTVMQHLLQLPSVEVTADDIHRGTRNNYADIGLDELQKGLKRLYVLMRHTALSQAPKLQTNLVHSFLVHLFNKIELSRPMVLFVVMLARTTRRQDIKDMVDIIQKAWYSSNQKNKQLLTWWFTDHQANLKSIALDKENVSIAPCEQLAQFFSRLVQERQMNVGSLKLPTSSSLEVDLKDALQMKKYLDIYDIDKGVNCLSMIKDVSRKDLREKAMVDFLQGHTIEPLALYFFETAECQTYADRCVYGDILGLTRGQLNYIKASYCNSQSVVKLYYDISAGGTTAGRVVLWRLRKEFPCVELLQLTDDAVQWSRHLYRITRLPLCMLIDQGHLHVNEANVRDFLERFKQNPEQADTEIVVKVVVLFVQRGSKEDALAEELGLWLSNSLIDEDKEKFDNLYTNAEKYLNEHEEPTAALHGLCQFGPSYYRLDKILLHIKDSCMGKERSLLLLCTVICFYTDAAMPLPLVAIVLGIDTNEIWGKTRLFSELTTSKNLLLLEPSGLKPVSKFLANEILEKIFEGKQEALLQFYDTFFDPLLKSPRNEAIPSLNIWPSSLFLHRRAMSENEQAAAQFSSLILKLVCSLPTWCSAKYMARITSEIPILDTNDGPHVMHAMQVRYLVYRFKLYHETNAMATREPKGKWIDKILTIRPMATREPNREWIDQIRIPNYYPISGRPPAGRENVYQLVDSIPFYPFVYLFNTVGLLIALIIVDRLMFRFLRIFTARNEPKKKTSACNERICAR